jgi:serine/threonine protein phosphatase PrpC
MICQKCASPISATDLYCENCGSPLSGTTTNNNLAATVQTCHCPPGQSEPDEDGYCQVCGIYCVPQALIDRRHVEQAIDRQLAVVSDIGRHHSTNQDVGMVARGSDNRIILIVSDGVSSSANSASASETAVKVAMNALLSAPVDADLSNTVRSAIESANQAIIELPFDGGNGDGPEATIVVALCLNGRAYLLKPDLEEQITIDDSWVEEVVRNGEMTREQAALDRHAHYVTQVLGMRDQQIDVHVIERELPGNSVLLLCSDGLWNNLQEDNALTNTLQHCDSEDALARCQYLVNLANEQGGHDNITVAMLLC